VLCRAERHVRLASLQRDVLTFTVETMAEPGTYHEPSTCTTRSELDLGPRKHDAEEMNELLVGYARVSTEQQDLPAQRHGLRAL
jgi:hypothetical protein